MSFDVWQLRILLIIVPRAPSPRICAEFSMRFSSPSKTRRRRQITPERLRLVNLVQWAALKCSRRSIRLQNAEFKKYIREVELSRRTPTVTTRFTRFAAEAATSRNASPHRRRKTFRRKTGEIGAKASSHIPPRHIEDSFSMEENRQPKRAR
ncbi:hypothetical protein TNCV_2443971 [Trichonephila clavipes]|nr:hypothetical protein TNCV_2443971 [Trichonephila clavipes]